MGAKVAIPYRPRPRDRVPAPPDLPLDPLAERWRFFYDNTLQREPDSVDRASARWLAELVPPNLRVLDVGTGTGHLLQAVRPGLAVGVDLSKRAVAAARERLPGATFAVADVSDYEPPQEALPFEAILCGQVLGEVTDPLRVLWRLRSWLAPEGRIFVLERTRRRHPPWAPPALPCRPPVWERLFRLGGYTVVRRERRPVRARRGGLRPPRWEGLRLWVLRPAGPPPSPLPAVDLVVPTGDRHEGDQALVWPPSRSAAEILRGLTRPWVALLPDGRTDGLQTLLEGARRGVGEVLVGETITLPQDGNGWDRVARGIGRLAARRLRLPPGTELPELNQAPRLLKRATLLQILRRADLRHPGDPVLFVVAAALHRHIVALPVRRPPAPLSGSQRLSRAFRLWREAGTAAARLKRL